MFVARYGDVAGDSRPPLVFVHGLGVTGYAFRRVLGAFEDRVVLVPDLLGSGSSDRPQPRGPQDYGWTFAGRNLGELLWRLDLGSVDVVAHGVGALAAASLARHTPSAVRRLVLVGAPCAGWRPPAWLTAAGTRWGGRALELGLTRGVLRRFLAARWSTPELADRDELAVYWGHVGRRGGRRALVATLRHLLDAKRIEVAYDGLGVSASLIWGDRDRIVPLELGRALAARIGAARFDVIDGCGHAPHEERPQAFAQVVREQLDGEVGPRSFVSGDERPGRRV
ncbi:MAG: alpha/beta hydrolase [Myxococcales bacterium FL481]|nr:MAG: alpha/beta hydrolase [Myxococcales bacterium FL481]